MKEWREQQDMLHREMRRRGLEGRYYELVGPALGLTREDGVVTLTDEQLKKTIPVLQKVLAEKKK